MTLSLTESPSAARHAHAASLAAAIARVLRHLPRRPPSFALALSLNLARGRLFAADAFAPMSGRHVRIGVTDLALELDVTLTASGFRAAPAGAKADVTIAAGSADLLALALRRVDSDSLFFDRRLRIEGDTELGLFLKNTLDGIELPGFAAGLRRT